MNKKHLKKSRHIRLASKPMPAGRGAGSQQPRLPALIAPKAMAISRKDMASWQKARRAATNIERPRRLEIISLYTEIMMDAHLTSQTDGRIESTLGAPFSLSLPSGEVDEDASQILSSSPGFARLMRLALETPLYGHSLLEITPTILATGRQDFLVSLLPRQHVIPEQGLLLFDLQGDQGIHYRQTAEYGKTILEFGQTDDLGLLCKAVPHALFKRFALSCWSELAEIYGIPPRFIKTDTSDPALVARAESMMRDMGAAAWWVIDQHEEFNFAKGADTNGDVYNNLITLCNNEMSLLISGAVLGQDTVNGNRSKEEVSIDLLDRKGAADRRMLEDTFNSAVLPALAALGIIPAQRLFSFSDEEDDRELWQRTIQALPYFDVDTDWIRNRFGIKVIAPRTGVAAPSSTQGESLSFFGQRE